MLIDVEFYGRAARFFVLLKLCLLLIRIFMNFSEENNTLICRFSGDLNGAVCDDIATELNDHVKTFLEDRDVAQIVFDLVDVHYISSAFLRLCLVYCKMVGPKNFQVQNSSPDVRSVFQIAGLTEIMNVK